MDILTPLNSIYTILGILASIVVIFAALLSALKFIRNHNLDRREEVVVVRITTAITIIIVLLVMGISVFLSYKNTTQPQLSGLPPQELYTQITSRSPSLNDPLNIQDSNQWDEYSSGNIGCGFNNGAYHAYALQPNVAECLAQATNYSNFAFQVRMTTIKGDGGGIIFGAEGANSRKYRFYVNTGTYYDLYVTLDDKRLLSDCCTKVIHSGLNRTNVLMVIVLSTNIYLYVNGYYIGRTDTINSGPLFGKIGMFAIEIRNSSNKNTPTEVIFNEVKVWQL